MRRAATRCPAAAISSASVLPERSSASLRVSETVSTAMLTARNGRDSSSRGMAEHLIRWNVQCGIDRPEAAGKLVEVASRLAEAQAIDPVIGEDALGEDARLTRRQAFEEEQRVVAVLRPGPPA